MYIHISMETWKEFEKEPIFAIKLRNFNKLIKCQEPQLCKQCVRSFIRQEN